MKIGKYEFDFTNEAYIMGILNVTPDSFSDGGHYNQVDNALFRVQEMIDEGATIIDIGGESTRPGYDMISDDEEVNRVVPVIEAIKNRFEVALSLDTYKSYVASEGIKAGVHMINDIWGFKYDKKLPQVVKDNQVVCCLMHNRKEAVYNDFIKDVLADLQESIDIAISAGIQKDKIILDPGVGFGKDYFHNLKMINECDKVCELGYPVLLGTSRKSVIGNTLNIPPEERGVGTAATTVLGYERGCRIFRVHDIRTNLEALKMARAIITNS